MKFKLKKQ